MQPVTGAAEGYDGLADELFTVSDEDGNLEITNKYRVVGSDLTQEPGKHDQSASEPPEHIITFDKLGDAPSWYAEGRFGGVRAKYDSGTGPSLGGVGPVSGNTDGDVSVELGPISRTYNMVDGITTTQISMGPISLSADSEGRVGGGVDIGTANNGVAIGGSFDVVRTLTPRILINTMNLQRDLMYQMNAYSSGASDGIRTDGTYLEYMYETNEGRDKSYEQWWLDKDR